MAVKNIIMAAVANAVEALYNLDIKLANHFVGKPDHPNDQGVAGVPRILSLSSGSSRLVRPVAIPSWPRGSLTKSRMILSSAIMAAMRRRFGERMVELHAGSCSFPASIGRCRVN